MANDKPNDLDQLRAVTSESARAMLDRIWNYYCERREGITCLALHSQFGGKASVLSTFAPLGGTVVYSIQEGGKRRYRLTLLGILIASKGQEAEDLMVHYLEYACKRYHSGSEEKITNAELEKTFVLSREQSHFLKQLIFMSPFNGGGSYREELGEPWHVDLPLDIDEACDYGDPRRR